MIGQPNPFFGIKINGRAITTLPVSCQVIRRLSQIREYLYARPQTIKWTPNEQQLQKAGIQVLAEEASNQSAFEGILHLRLKFIDHQPAKKAFLSLDEAQEKIEKVDTRKKYVYAIRLNLRQLVTLQRDPSAKAFSITWQAESLGLRRLALIKEDIKSLVDVFIEAYTSENPAALKTN